MKHWYYALPVILFFSCKHEPGKLPKPSMEDNLYAGDYVFVSKKNKDSVERALIKTAIGFDSTSFRQLLDSFVPTLARLKKPYACGSDTIACKKDFMFPPDSLACAHRQPVVLYRFRSSDYYQDVDIKAYHQPGPAFADRLLTLMRQPHHEPVLHPNVNNHVMRTRNHVFWISAAFYFPPKNFEKIVELFKKSMAEKEILDQVR